MTWVAGLDARDVKRISWLIGRAPKEMAVQFRVVIAKLVRGFREFFIDERLSGRPGLKGGRLLRAFVAVTPAPGTPLEAIEGRTFFREPWVPIHETGGTITPRTRQYLAIPLPGAKTQAGFLRGMFVRTAGEGSPYAGQRSLRGVKGLFAFRSKKGNLLLGMSKGGNLTPLFVLKKQVRIKKRLHYFATWRRWIRGSYAAGIIQTGIRKTMEMLKRGR